LDWDPDSEYWDSAENKLAGKKPMIQPVVPKIAGHSATAMWVYGNNLIYTTPNNLKNKVGVLRSSYLDFYRVDLDGKNNSLIYTADTENITADKFTVWAKSANDIYLIINDGGTLKRVDMQGRTAEIAAGITAAVFPSVSEYKQNSQNQKLDKLFGGIMEYVYYTKSRDSGENVGGNKMFRYNIASGNGNEAPVAAKGDVNGGDTYTPKAVTDGKFFYTVKGSETQSVEKLCVSANVNDNYLTLYKNIVTEVSNMKFYKSSLAMFGNKLYKYTVQADVITIPQMQIISSADEVSAVTDDKIYVKVGTVINIFDHNGNNTGAAGADISAKKAEIPVSVITPHTKNGNEDLGSGGRLIFVMTETGIDIKNENNETFVLKIF
jgi:hypothetical protein